MPAIDGVHKIAQHLRGLKVQINGKAMQPHRYQAQADVLQAIDKIIPLFFVHVSRLQNTRPDTLTECAG